MQVYGGFFIILSYVWGYLLDGFKPDSGQAAFSKDLLRSVCVWYSCDFADDRLTILQDWLELLLAIAQQTKFAYFDML